MTPISRLSCNALIGLFTFSFLYAGGLVWAAPQKVTNEIAVKAQGEAPAPRNKVFDAESFTLDNGLQVIVIPNNRAPVVTQMLWHKVGAADEVHGHSGIAHFLEHLSFKGSQRIGGEPLKPGEFSQIIRSIGGNDNAFTSHDYTAYFQSAPADKLEMIMRMEAGRINGVTPPMEEVDSERKVVIEERKQRTDNDPRAQFQEQLAAQAFINHPYGKPVIGWAHEMAAMQWPQIKAFYDRWYAPNTSILVITGDATPADVFQKAIEIYGGLPREDIPERIRPQSPPFTAKTHIQMTNPAIREPLVQTLYRVPSARQNKTESLALQVLEEIMDGGPSSRLYKTLISETKIATSVGFSYSGDVWDDASLWLYGTPSETQTLESLQKALSDQLALVVDKGVSEQELLDAKNRLIDQAAYARDSLTGPAMIIGQALATGLSLDDVEYWPYDIEAITAADVQAVAAKYLNSARPSAYPPVTGYLLPAAPAEKEAPTTKQGNAR